MEQKRKNNVEIEDRLANKLRDIYDDNEDVIISILSCVSDYIDDVEELLRYIEEDNPNKKEIIEYAYSIQVYRDPSIESE